MQYGQLVFKTFLSLSFYFLCVSTGFSSPVTSKVPYSMHWMPPAAQTSADLSGEQLVVNEQAAMNEQSTGEQPTQWVPRITGWGLLDVTDGEGLGKVDLMFPLSQMRMMPFIDFQGKKYTTPDSWTGSVGLGYRQLSQDNRIWGGYLFGDYSKISHHHFWVINPGIESLGKILDFRANLYIPVGKNGGIKKDIGIRVAITFRLPVMSNTIVFIGPLEKWVLALTEKLGVASIKQKD